MRIVAPAPAATPSLNINCLLCGAKGLGPWQVTEDFSVSNKLQQKKKMEIVLVHITELVAV